MLEKYKESAYGDVRHSMRMYWANYGGFKALFLSPYLHMSAVLTVTVWPMWCRREGDQWYSVAIDVLPNLIGFAIAGYAILVSVGDEKFRLAVSGKGDDGKPSPFMKANATFLHFVVVNTVALLLALVAKCWDWVGCIPAFFAFSVFVYAVMCALASGLAVLNVAHWYDLHAAIEKKRIADEERRKQEQAGTTQFL